MARKNDIDNDEGTPLFLLDESKLPASEIGGKPNPAHYRERFRWGNMASITWAAQGKVWPNHKAYNDGLKEECKTVGIDPDSLADTRSEAQILEDVVRAVIETPQSNWAALDREIEAMEEFFSSAVEQGIDGIIKKMEEAKDERRTEPLTREEVAAIRREGKAWLSRLTRIKRLRQMVRNPSWTTRDKIRQAAEEATHVLRFMCYVGRTSTDTMGANKTDLYRLSPRRVKFGKDDIGHHIWLAMSYWRLRKQVYFYSGGVQRGVLPYQGAQNVLPPGHGKTDFGLHCIALEIVLKPTLRVGLLHAKVDRSMENLRLLCSMFDPEKSNGRRLRSLFPDTPLFRKKPTSTSFDLDVDVPRKSETCTAFGVGERTSGADLDVLYIDDPVDQEEAQQESSRETTHRRIHGTWMNRLRSVDSFWIYNTTLWHDDDASSRLIKLLGRRKIWFVCYIDGAGGPDEDFCPVWADSGVHTKTKFKTKFETSPRDYMTIYACKPTADGLSMVKELALYAVTDPSGATLPEHQDFLYGAQRIISIDPAATGKKTSDNSGVVYAGVGHVRRRRPDGMMEVRRRVRLLAAQAVRASPTVVMDYIARFSQVEPVHRILIETAGAMVMFADQMEQRYGRLVERMAPAVAGQGLVGKASRLKNAQPYIDNSMSKQGIEAVVEWPGEWKYENATTCSTHPDGGVVVDGQRAICAQCHVPFNSLMLDRRMQWLADEVLKFGVCGTDDGLDALTQLVAAVANQVGIGGGVALPEAIIPDSRFDERLVRMFGDLKKSLEPRSCDAAEEISTIGSNY